MSPSCTNSEIASLKVVRFPTQVAQQTICQYATITKSTTGRSAAWLARLPWEQEVDGSNPFAPISLTTRSVANYSSRPNSPFWDWRHSLPLAYLGSNDKLHVHITALGINIPLLEISSGCSESVFF